MSPESAAEGKKRNVTAVVAGTWAVEINPGH